MSFQPTLLLGAVPRIAVPVARSLFRKEIPVFCACFGPEQPPIRSRAIQRSFVFGPLDVAESKPVQEIIRTIQAEGIDYIVPCNDSSLRYLVHHYDLFHGEVKLGCPAPEIVSRVLDKSLTLTFARQCGIPVPKEVYETATLEDIAAALSFPVVVKPRTKIVESQFKVRYFENIDELRECAKNIPDFLAQYVVQEYCPGEGVGIEILMNDGSPVMVFQHRRITEHPRSGGVSAVAVSQAPEPLLVDIAVQLLQAIQWQGVAMVEFKYDRASGKAALMEVNGRYWGSLGLSAACRFDFPYVQWAIDHGVDVEIPTVYPIGVTARWTAGLLANLLDGLDHRETGFNLGTEVRQTLSELFLAKKDMVFEWKDPVPAFQEAAQLLRHDIPSIAKRRLRSAFPRAVEDILFTRRYGLPFALRLGRRRLRRRFRRPRMPAHAKNVLIVCHGNIIRSALAEHLFRKGLQPDSELSVQSAGIVAVNGKPSDPRVVAAAADLFGVDLSSHVATRLTFDHVSNSDVIFVMDHQNEIALLHRFPEAGDKLFLLGELCPDESENGVEIVDPYHGTKEDVAACCRRISSCIDKALRALETTSRKPELRTSS